MNRVDIDDVRAEVPGAEPESPTDDDQEMLGGANRDLPPPTGFSLLLYLFIYYCCCGAGITILAVLGFLAYGLIMGVLHFFVIWGWVLAGKHYGEGGPVRAGEVVPMLVFDCLYLVGYLALGLYLHLDKVGLNSKQGVLAVWTLAALVVLPLFLALLCLGLGLIGDAGSMVAFLGCSFQTVAAAGVTLFWVFDVKDYVQIYGAGLDG